MVENVNLIIQKIMNVLSYHQEGKKLKEKEMVDDDNHKKTERQKEELPPILTTSTLSTPTIKTTLLYYHVIDQKVDDYKQEIQQEYLNYVILLQPTFQI